MLKPFQEKVKITLDMLKRYQHNNLMLKRIQQQRTKGERQMTPPRKKKPAANASRNPNEEKQPPQELYDPRGAYSDDVKRLRSLNLPRISRLADDKSLICVLALMDLFATGDHLSYGCAEAARNWLGTFFCQVLMLVSRENPQAALAQPKQVRGIFDECVESLSFSLVTRDFLPNVRLEDLPPLDLDAA